MFYCGYKFKENYKNYFIFLRLEIRLFYCLPGNSRLITTDDEYPPLVINKHKTINLIVIICFVIKYRQTRAL